jgi:hypothetical protein
MLVRTSFMHTSKDHDISILDTCRKFTSTSRSLLSPCLLTPRHPLPNLLNHPHNNLLPILRPQPIYILRALGQHNRDLALPLLRLLRHGHVFAQHFPRRLERVPNDHVLEQLASERDDVVELLGRVGEVGGCECAFLGGCRERFLSVVSYGQGEGVERGKHTL